MEKGMQEKARRIIGDLAQEGRVEATVRTVAHTDRLAWDLEDLCQEVYCVLLRYPADKVVDLWETDCIGFFIVRVVLNMLRSKTSRFYYIYKRFQALCSTLDGVEVADDD